MLMRFIRYFTFSVIFIIAVVYAITNTKTGNKLAYFYLSDTLSEKTHLNINVKSINFFNYPDVSAEILIEDKYALNISGAIYDYAMLDLNYTISSDCLESNVCSIEDDVHITGDIKGHYRNIHITGKGRVLDGNISIEGTKKRRTTENVTIRFSDVNSTKLLTLLGEKEHFHGKSNAYLHFDTIGKKGKKGTFHYDVKDNNFSNMQVALAANVEINDDKYTFNIDANTPTSTLNIMNGKYDRETKYATAVYVLDIKDLTKYKKLLNVKIVGPFYAYGNIIYDKKIKMQGMSKSFGGILDIFYAKKEFNLYLNDVPFNNIMQRLSYDPLLDAKMIGKLKYDVSKKMMQTKVRLKDVKFLQKEMVDLINEKFEYNINDKIFKNSSFEAQYKDKILTSNLKIANDENRFIFRNTELNSIEKSIDTTIDFKIKKHYIAGKLYARHDGYFHHTLDTYLKFDGLVEKHYHLNLDGPLSKKWANIDYKISAARCPSHICTIVDDVNISGHLSGPYKRLYIQAEGKALNGHIRFDGLKIDDTFKDLTLDMTDIHAKKLFTLLGTPDLPSGRATISAHFKTFNQEHKKGDFTYELKKGHYANLPLEFTSNVNVKDDHYAFSADVHVNDAHAKLTQGFYDANQSKTHTFYTLDVKNISTLEPLLGAKYNGSFNATGELNYHKNLHIRGLSKTFGGFTDFLYKNDVLYVDFENASFKRIMSLFPYPLYLDAATNGSINYHFDKKLFLVNTKLNNAHFLPSDFIATAYKKAGIYLQDEIFDNSSLELTYQNNILVGDLKLANPAGHIFLTNVQVDNKLKNVDAYFDVNLQKQAFTGKIYGSLDHPKINLDMQKLIAHEMDKQLDSVMGSGPREMMESMPMGGVAKDVVTGTAGSFMGIFF